MPTRSRSTPEHVIWEIVSDSEEAPTLEIEGGSDFDLGLNDNYEDELSEENPFLSSVAISVVHGHLMISSHVDFIREIIEQPSARRTRWPTCRSWRTFVELWRKLGADDTRPTPSRTRASRCASAISFFEKGRCRNRKA